MAVTFGFRDIVLALRDAGLAPGASVLVIGPVQPPDELRGGVPALLSAVQASCGSLITPAFTFQTMVYPPVGPEENGIDYEAISAISTEAEFFRAGMPVSPMLGPFPEAVRRLPGALRSSHPVLSFTGINAQKALEQQTLDEPLAPVDALVRAGGDVLLLGADPSQNVALYLAEQRAGRKQFLRWALTTNGVVECPAFPGCAKGFGAISLRLQGVEQVVDIGRADGGGFRIIRIPLRDMLHEASAWIREDPRALLCDQPGCPLCSAVRRSLAR